MKSSQKSKQKHSSNSQKVISLYLLNDDYNTFDYVIDCLTAICDHTTLQAEQCAILTHYRGSCEIMIGEKFDLEPVKEDLALYGLNVKIL